MVTQLTPGKDDEAAIMLCAGHICLQWSLFEGTLMEILAACQGTCTDETAILFGSLDMKPRLNMAINLASFHKWPSPMQKRLRDLRKAVDKSTLIDRRNMIVHGVPSQSTVPSKTVHLYTPRRSGPAQREDWSVIEAQYLGEEIRLASSAARGILNEFVAWEASYNRTKDARRQFVTIPIGRIARIKQYLSARLNRFRRQVD